ncbi:MAG: lipoate--protein ligase family protein [Deltaproteobacteria bacterium]|nr:lipoate--protein ligase family protein [Deltaproteobacteria bacterium]
MEEWRLIIDGPESGTFNMAADESLLSVVSKAQEKPTLRLYSWREPSITIGYSQDASFFNGSEVPVIRRLTGGRAVLHFDELTYSITCPAGTSLFDQGIHDVYRLVGKCLKGALDSAGLECYPARSQQSAGGNKKASCFHAPNRYELLCDGKKVTGSAQRRFKDSFIQHGSVMLSVNEEMFMRVFPGASTDKIGAVSSYCSVGFDELSKLLIDSFKTHLGASFEHTGYEKEERSLIEQLIKSKYSNDIWNLHGKSMGVEAA